MATFIEEVALRLYEKYGDGVSSLTILLPTKRARLFLAEALSKVVVNPIWEPEYSSIDDLMCECSGLRKADRLRLVAELHTIYSRYRQENFDEFYGWGEILISDFDMLDKYMVEASQLFANVRDLKELESDMSYLTPEQVKFWRTIVGDRADITDGDSIRNKFIDIWRHLGTIYDEFRLRLRELGIGYTGMIYREAVERLKSGEASFPTDKKFLFIGFNALSKCEKTLLRHLQNLGQAEFYWDYDNYYVDDNFQEAGMFIRENIAQFGCEKGVSHDNFRNIGSMSVFSTSSAVAQCQGVVKVLEEIASRNGGVLGKDTAIVLTDESLLLPLLYALPEKFKVKPDGESTELSVNVTMGYPLNRTFAYSFIERLLALQKHLQYDKQGNATFYHTDTIGLLSHPYIVSTAPEKCESLRAEIKKHRYFQVPMDLVGATPLLSKIFRNTTSWQEQSDYLLDVIEEISATPYSGEDRLRNDFLAMMSEAIIKLRNVLDSCNKKLSEKTYNSLLRRYLQSEKAPFTGEPLEGLQIMGILETRNLDFKNVILLSMTDSNFPGSHATDKSFIPYSLRCGFEIPTAEHHEGVYAYYFYRLIERAESVSMFYSTISSNKSAGEPSRYIRQLEYETDFDIAFTNIGVEVSFSNEYDNILIEKSDKVYDKLLEYTRDNKLSPTAISSYLNCPLKFYFDYIERMRPEEELEEEVDSLTFGNIFHEAADMLYKKIEGDNNPAARLEQLRNSGEVERCVDRAIMKRYFNRDENTPLPELGGELMIIRNIVREYLRSNLLNYDIRNSDFSVIKTEYKVDMTLPIEVGGEQLNVRLGGRADRVDSLNNGMLRVIDYKTGREALTFNGVRALFKGYPVKRNRPSNIINTLLYAMMLRKEFNRDVRPELFYVGSMVNEDYCPQFIENRGRTLPSKRLVAYSEYAEEFERELYAMLQELFDKSIPITQTCDAKVCELCHYCSICNRG